LVPGGPSPMHSKCAADRINKDKHAGNMAVLVVVRCQEHTTIA
jgi:hypothetical protein